MHALGHEMALLPRVNPRVIAGCLDPVDRVELDQRDPGAIADANPPKRSSSLHLRLRIPKRQLGRRPLVGDAISSHARERPMQREGVHRPEPLERACDRRAKTGATKWLQHVVERVDVERANRMLVVGGDEYDPPWNIVAQRIQYPETVLVGHLNIEKEQVRTKAPDECD